MELAIWEALRATVSRGSAFAGRLVTQGVCAGFLAYLAQKLSERSPKHALNRSLLVRLTDEGVRIARQTQLIITMGLLVQMQAS